MLSGGGAGGSLSLAILYRMTDQAFVLVGIFFLSPLETSLKWHHSAKYTIPNLTQVARVWCNFALVLDIRSCC